MAVTVLVHAGAAEPRHLTFDSPRVVIGRGEGCEVRLPDPSVSQRHASIRQRGADYIVLDEGSTNGTFVGSVRLGQGTPRLLRSGDRLRVGRVWLEVRVEQAPVTQNPAVATKELALALVAAGLAGQGEPAAMRIEVRSGPGAGRSLELPLADRPYVVGRGKDADLPLEDPDLSRRHVQIVRRADRALVRDLGSKNGSRLDDTPLGSDKDVPWPSSKALVIGGHVLGLEDPVRQALGELERLADERLDDGYAPEPPGADAADPEPSTAAPAEPPPAQTVPVMSTQGRRAAPQLPGGWTGTDYLVALAAVLVLVMSLVALLWLIDSG